MDDSRIIGLFNERSETAISEAEKKYGRYCLSIACNILHDNEDAAECVNDALLGAWNSIPPHAPENLAAFLGKITRNLSLKKWREQSAAKRGGGNTAVSLDELEECIPSGHTIDEHLETEELTGIINSFLAALPDTERRVFLRRYWYFDTVDDICGRFGFGKSKVKMILKRTRDKLRKKLEKEGIYL
ncbi:MAG: sigma-70 family RNA polymerase sigma factor [Lachnospiraceae bacterium]|nr:sigma-70 family RNA polymerase sigma factor [Lachnospiraceae bacterium]